MEKAIKPASTGTISAKAEPPPICISAAAGVFHFKRFDPEGKGERDTQAPATTIGSI